MNSGSGVFACGAAAWQTCPLPETASRFRVPAQPAGAGAGALTAGASAAKAGPAVRNVSRARTKIRDANDFFSMEFLLQQQEMVLSHEAPPQSALVRQTRWLTHPQWQ